MSSNNNNSNNNNESGFEYWRRTLQYRTGLGLTSELKESYEKDYGSIINRKNCEECYKYRDWMLQYSPTVIFMIQQIEKLSRSDPKYSEIVHKLESNLNLDNSASTSDLSKELNTVDKNITNTNIFNPSKQIICDICPDMTKSGGFHPMFGILICANRLKDKWHLEDTLSHELVHYYDNIKFKVDWLNLKHHACSEIRASTLSGECRFMQEFSRRMGVMKISKGFQECVKRRAILSVMGNPNCKSKEHAEKVVDEVWESCFNDTRPFETIYR
ncbi:probable Mitochondrial inner membrane protease ATP23 [Saccharomycodes ludwigii]|uniref:Mitochondrial inner membrane protease ATP23 n=1 Tax=Saccharomycodes ludwigii TaxID=36035 RepID=A0A376B646_9ASCO|nr:probable Mitochondrial inner membrane protease ATP23 [Saccharomycodes ludwigii]